ncbi:MAG: insulinase family protein [Polyangiaceae bacterium]|nr:insulinase family protein [Polyangiaceae bacterium]
MKRDLRRLPLLKRRTALALLGGAALSAATWTGPGASLAHAATAAAPGVSIPVQKYTLKNGLTVLMSPDHSLPVVAVEVRYLVGSSYEVKGKSGFAHLFEHLMFQGSEHFDHEYFAPFEPIGGVVNGTTNTDRTNYFERVPSQYLELALWMESDRMFGLLPKLDQAKLDNQRDVVKNERRQSYENQPYGMFWFYLSEAIYPEGHPYRHLTIGSHNDLTHASLEDVRAFFKQYYNPANAVLTLVGDFKPEDAKKLVEKYFDQASSGTRSTTPKVEPVKLQGVKHLKYTDAVATPKVYFAWPTPALFADGDAALDVLASILSDGKTSRLYKPLVFDQKIAKDVNAYQASSQLGSVYVVEATAADKKTTADQLGKALFAALKKALAKPPTQDELERSLNGWKKSYYGRVQSVLSRAQLLSGYYHFTGDPDYVSKDLARYTAVGAKEVEAAAKFLDLENYVRIDISPGPKPEISDSMGGG